MAWRSDARGEWGYLIPGATSAPGESVCMSSATDPSVVEGVDSSAIAARYRTPIYRYILRLVRDPDRADDLTQETFLRVHQRLDALKDIGALDVWLYRIATNLCYDHFREREHRRPMLPALSGDDELTAAAENETALRPDQLLQQSEMSDCVLHFLAELPPSQREVLILHDLQGFSGPEIADRLRISLDNVKIRLHRARTRLRAALTSGCDFDHDERDVFVCEPMRR